MNRDINAAADDDGDEDDSDEDDDGDDDDEVDDITCRLTSATYFVVSDCLTAVAGRALQGEILAIGTFFDVRAQIWNLMAMLYCMNIKNRKQLTQL